MFLLAALFTPQLLAQSPPASELSQFIDANARFGRQLLWHSHSSSPNKNIALAPLPVSLTFAALSDTSASTDVATTGEISKVFGWDDIGNTKETSHILVTLFEKPKPPRPKNPPGMPANLLPSNPLNAWEGIWFTTQFQCACLNLLSQYFVRAAREDFGIVFENESDRKGTSTRKTIPQMSTLFRITDSIHLKTSWNDGIVEQHEREGAFTLESGRQEQVEMINSELAHFAYANTKDFEEVVLPGEEAYMLVVLPAQGKTVAEIEKEIANAAVSPESQLQQRLGSVDFPTFEFTDNRELTPVLEEMGVRRAFGTLDAFSAMTTGSTGAQLTRVSQAVKIDVDEKGIRADAVIGFEGVIGGIMGGTTEPPPPPHFHMVVNRPFLFFVRDNMTGSLVFEGAVMNPQTAN